MDALDRRIVNRAQRGLPLSHRPFRDLADEIDTDEATLLQRLDHLLRDGVLTRFGPLFDAARLGGELSLCAMQVPADRFEDVTRIVNDFDAVAHNYERQHALNMWFVLATSSLDEKQAVLAEIEQRTGLAVLDLPKEREYFVGLYVEA